MSDEKCMITEEEIQGLIEEEILSEKMSIVKTIRSRTLSAELHREIPSSKELILLAEHDWHNREERKGLYPMIPWTHGWIAGFLSEKKPYWPKEHDAAIAKAEQERVIDLIWNWVDNADNHTKDIGNGRYYVHLPDLVRYTESLRGEQS